MNEAQLQIVISVINDAAAQLGDIAAQLSGLADETAGAASDMTDSMTAAGTSMAESVSAAASTADAQLADMADATAAASDEMESSISSVGGKIQAVGIQLGILGAAITAPAALAVKAAGDQAEAFDQLANSVENVYGSANAPAAGYATEVADLTAKINSEKSTIAEADAAMTKWTGTVAVVSAAHEKAASTVATAQVNLQKYQQELDNLTNSQSLAGGSAEATVAQFEAAAKASTSLGFDASDAATALTYLFSATQNVDETMSAYQDAMDLAAKLQIPLAQAANDVVQAMNGQGRALRDLGINVADGLSGQTALAAIQEKVAGAAEDAATHGLGPYNVAMAQLNEAMANFGVTVLPMLAAFFEWLSKIITAVGDWAAAHPKLAEALIVFLGILGGILLILAPILTLFGFMVITIEAVTTATVVLGVSMLPLLTTFALVAAGVMALIAVFALIIVFHTQMMDAVKAAWTWIVNFITGAITAVLAGVLPGITTLVSFLFDHWNTIKTDVENAWNWIANFISGIWDKIVTTVQTAVSTIQNLNSKVMAPLTSVANIIPGLSSVLGNVASTAIAAFANGGIVTGPTLALVGEAGPEAIIPLSAFAGGPSLAGVGAGSAGNIVININGGSYLDEGGAQQIAAALASQIGRQLKLKNFF